MRKILLLCFLVFPVGALAQWSGESSAGYLVTTGNADTTSLNAKLALEFKAEGWKNTFMAAATNTGGDTGATAERYSLSEKVDYTFFSQNYTFGVVEYERDLFGGTRERLSEAIGVGRHILTGPAHTWDAEVGVGARQTRANVTNEENAEAITRFSTLYQWKISETAALAENLKVESGEANTFSESSTELKLTVIGNLAAVLTYSLRHNSNVPPGSAKLDTTTGATLSYAFGKT